MRGTSPKPEKVAKAEKHMNNCLDIIETIWLKDKPFLVGNTISVADIFGVCELEQPREFILLLLLLVLLLSSLSLLFCYYI